VHVFLLLLLLLLILPTSLTGIYRENSIGSYHKQKTGEDYGEFSSALIIISEVSYTASCLCEYGKVVHKQHSINNLVHSYLQYMFWFYKKKKNKKKTLSSRRSTTHTKLQRLQICTVAAYIMSGAGSHQIYSVKKNVNG
jgi:hypothetical protein